MNKNDKLSSESKRKLQLIRDNCRIYFDTQAEGDEYCIDGWCNAEELRMMADIIDELKMIE